MTVRTKQLIITVLSLAFLASLILVQWMEVARKEAEAGLVETAITVPDNSKGCVDCHRQGNPGIVAHWEGSTHAAKGVGCVECHSAADGDVDAFTHYNARIAVVVTPRDCSRCHQREYEEFERSHHAKGGNILASLDNRLAEVVEGFRDDAVGSMFDPHSPTPGRGDLGRANGLASAMVGCNQCHGARVALMGTDGTSLTRDDFKPDANGKPTNRDAVGRIARDENGKPKFDARTWPNTGIGRINLDGSLGSCTACHSRHDFSPRRARQPENCGKCHLGPDHPQKEIYEESKHGVAYRDLKDKMNLDSPTWILGKDYSAAPTCATCHMSRHSRSGSKVTHDPGVRISWTNRPPVSLVMDTDIDHEVVTETDAGKREAMVHDTWRQKRERMQEVCGHCHTPDYIHAFYRQYDEFVQLYNEKFAKPGKKIMAALRDNGLITRADFDEEIEWTWFYLWHHEGRRARHGASMMAPDYAHWHGMYEVAERFYMGLVPQAREIAEQARAHGKGAEGTAVLAVVDGILARPEHRWQGEGR